MSPNNTHKAYFPKNIYFYNKINTVSRMKKKLMGAMMNNIKKNISQLNEEQLEIIEYGLEGLYLTFTKIIIILVLSILLNIVKETLLVLLFYNTIRLFAFGLHAKNSTACLITSLTLFIGGTYLAIYLNISLLVKIILSSICLILILIYAPADTEKRPLINKKKRKRFKILSIITSLIMTIIIIYLHNNYLSNFMIIGFIEATIMILPITYKLYGLPYNNYKNFSNI